eukprot:TRINITY_DN69022_c0_g1_i1.p1 TRINITY_DN69022_c0_g1~~TRINITY_DN69022_c0_g1_i1.p1  ORF type:complete len:968 (-),score=106.88 TRINITY_DN69022_c0_g1_i1:403-3306(-)
MAADSEPPPPPSLATAEVSEPTLRISPRSEQAGSGEDGSTSRTHGGSSNMTVAAVAATVVMLTFSSMLVIQGAPWQRSRGLYEHHRLPKAREFGLWRRLQGGGSNRSTAGCLDVYKQPLGRPPMCVECAAFVVEDIAERCKIDTDDCQKVTPGGECKLTCAAPYIGQPKPAKCVAGNSNPVKRLDLPEGLPSCVCPDPDVPPEGFTRAYGGGWKCADGFAGVPEKRCGCGETHDLTGCFPLSPCASPDVDMCRYDISKCNIVPPGGTCVISCKTPQFASGKTVASCPDNNTQQDQQLIYFPLRCLFEESECPDPPAPPGYTLTSSGWECAEGYNGKVTKTCTTGPTWKSDCTAAAELTGCKKIVNCLPPSLTGGVPPGMDACEFDVSFCVAVRPNGTCKVNCRSPYVGLSQEAFCPDRNTNPNGLQWTKPSCSLEVCGEPETVPNGYLKAANAVGYVCETSYSGYPRKVCEPTLGCEPQPKLEGCTQRIPCSEPKEWQKAYTSLFWDVANQMSVQITADGDVNTGSLQVIHPLTSRSGIGIYSNAFLRVFFGESGVEERGKLVLSKSKLTMSQIAWDNGNTWLRNVTFDDETCLYQFSDCGSVQPGESCSITCKAPYVGNASSGVCSSTNIDVGGLVWTRPDCISGTTCPDPLEVPVGFEKSPDGVRCADGYTGVVVKKCIWIEEDCTTVPIVEGCRKTVPCAPYEVPAEDVCTQNVSSKCQSVESGETCEVGCLSPFYGAPATLTCPSNNLDPNRQLEGAGAVCDCPPPNPVPPGYNMSISREWVCARGFVGTAVKACPSTEDCKPNPTLMGCAAPVACDGSVSQDDDAMTNKLDVVISFGAALVDSTIDERNVLNYGVFWVDACGLPLREAGPRVPKMSAMNGSSCCSKATYAVAVRGQIPDDAVQLGIFVNATTGLSPARKFLEIEDRGTAPVVSGWAWRSAEPSAAASAIGAVVVVLATVYGA